MLFVSFPPHYIATIAAVLDFDSSLTVACKGSAEIAVNGDINDRRASLTAPYHAAPPLELVRVVFGPKHRCSSWEVQAYLSVFG